MEKITCDVIGDLLPLYVDDACSDDSRDLVEAHLTECKDCRDVFNAMCSENPIDAKTKLMTETKIIQSLRNRLLAIGLALFMIVGCFIGNWIGTLLRFPVFRGLDYDLCGGQHSVSYLDVSAGEKSP